MAFDVIVFPIVVFVLFRDLSHTNARLRHHHNKLVSSFHLLYIAFTSRKQHTNQFRGKTKRINAVFLKVVSLLYLEVSCRDERWAAEMNMDFDLNPADFQLFDGFDKLLSKKVLFLDCRLLHFICKFASAEFPTSFKVLHRVCFNLEHLRIIRWCKVRYKPALLCIMSLNKEFEWLSLIPSIIVIIQRYFLLSNNTYSTVHHYLHMCSLVLMIPSCCILYLAIFLIWYLSLYNWASHCIYC